MKKYAIISNSIVVNVVDYDTAPINPLPGFPEGYTAIQVDNVSPGWLYKDEKFIDPNPPTPAYIPQQVPMWAVRTVLQRDNLFDQINTIIAGSADLALKNVWEYGNFADRNSAAINTIAYTLNLTETQVDQMFIDANNLNV